MYHHEKTEEVHSVEQVSSFLVDDQKLKNSKDEANAFNNFFITTEKLNVLYKKEMLSQY